MVARVQSVANRTQLLPPIDSYATRWLKKQDNKQYCAVCDRVRDKEVLCVELFKNVSEGGALSWLGNRRVASALASVALDSNMGEGKVS